MRIFLHGRLVEYQSQPRVVERATMTLGGEEYALTLYAACEDGERLRLAAVSDLGMLGGGEGLGAVFRWLSIGVHVQALVQGLVDTADLVYFAVMIGSFLLLTRLAVDSVRWR